MLDGIVVGLLISGIPFIFLFISFGVVFAAKNGLPWKNKRKSPFSSQFLRSPGHSVYDKVDDLKLDVLLYVMFVMAIPLMVISTIYMLEAYTGKTLSLVNVSILVLVAIIFLLIQLRRLYYTARNLKRMRLGYEAEVAVGQELNQLMLRGFHVFHDFPADNFNIDHVVIGPTGVFAVETKGRSKPDTGDGKADARVLFDGETLRFPHWVERQPVPQTRRQAVWLAQWISKAVGEKVSVIPVLSIPGWFTENRSKSDVRIFFGKQPEKFFLRSFGINLSQVMVNRIAFQIEAKCRDIDPKSYADVKSKVAG